VQRRRTQAELLLERYGIVTREQVLAEGIPGGFSSLYDQFAALETVGVARRGYFIEGLGGAQFALPGADERLRVKSDDEKAVVLAATDPANPYGAALPWPDGELRPQRTPGALTVLYQGRLIAYLGKSDRLLSLFLSEEEPARSHQLSALLAAFKTLVGPGRRKVLLIQMIDRVEAARSPHAAAFLAAGFGGGASGLSLRRGLAPLDESETLEDA
jgi:ATP-dependent Lhr-like helicase